MSRAEKNQSPPSSSPITSLPDDLVVDILARVPICDYPRVSLVSKHFHSLLSSHEIYARRSSLGCTEHCLYVVLHNWDDGVDRLYTFRRKGNDGNSSRRLVLIPVLPAMPRYGGFVAVGSRIYVFSGTNSFSIDCSASHTVQHLPNMPVPMSNRVADVIGGRIYVFGFIDTDPMSYAMVVFDTETQTWEGPMTVPGLQQLRNGCLVVTSGKMYMRDFQKSLVYDPKESKWEKEEMLSSKFWEDACAVDDVLFFYGDFYKKLKAYDPEHKCWGVVNGLDDLFAETRGVGCRWLQAGSCGGKMVFFYAIGRSLWLTKEICCAEISLERRKGGQFWGKVDQWRSDHALIDGNFFITKSLDVVL